MPKKQKRYTITDTFDDVSPCELECTLTDLKDKIQGWIDKYGPTARLDWDAYFHYDYDPNPSPRFNIKRDREETDAEYNARLNNESIQRSNKEAHERAEYERLKNIFEGKK